MHLALIKGLFIYSYRTYSLKVLGQIKACWGYTRCDLRGKRQVRINMGFVLIANNLLNTIREGVKSKKLEFLNWKSLAFLWLRTILSQIL